MDFFEYDQRFQSRYENAAKLSGFTMGKVGLAYLFWSKAGIDDRTLSDLRLKVDGKLDRSDEMKSIYRRILKNEHAAVEQSGQGNRQPYPLVGYEDEYWLDEQDGQYDDDHGFGYWTCLLYTSDAADE